MLAIFLSFVPVLTAIVVFFSTVEVHAYPEFIGMGYTGCMTCHYNGAGNGGLNDYGRGLFAAEIASKLLWNSKKTDESLSERSGFLGSKTLPFWFRPSLKYRGLTLEKNPGGKELQSRTYYQMQQDFNLHIPFNEEQTLLFALNLGTVTTEAAATPNKTFSGSLILTREHYLRGQMTEYFWFYLGMMDKVFGIRHPDHTAVNRGFLGLGQNDQVHALVLHYAKDSHEFFFNPFVGNLFVKSKAQIPGFTVHYEHDIEEMFRVGVSFMRDRDAVAVEKNTLALLLKKGIQGGHSLLFETGIKNAVGSNSKATNSAYLWSQATMRFVRGLFFQSSMEYFKGDISKLSTENLRFGVGLLAFPFQRVEFRVSGVSGRTINPVVVDKDSWDLMSQLHLSF